MKPPTNCASPQPIDQPDFDCPLALRPHITVVLAMSADGKIADHQRSPARFGSTADKLHLETQIAQADAVLFGADTLRAYGTTLRVTQPALIAQRQQQGKPLQPVHIVCSRSGLRSSTGDLPTHLHFFQQAVPRWLLTGTDGAIAWQGLTNFDRVIAISLTETGIHWQPALAELRRSNLQRLVITGGGQLVASLLDEHAIDEIWLTVCPLLLGGKDAPSPVAGLGFAATLAPRLDLIEVKAIDQEVFLHYRLQGSNVTGQ